MPEAVESGRYASLGTRNGPFLRKCIGAAGGAIPVAEHQGIFWRLTEPKRQPTLLGSPPVSPQFSDGRSGEGDRAPTVTGLRGFKD